jgi:hypothetical protein
MERGERSEFRMNRETAEKFANDRKTAGKIGMDLDRVGIPWIPEGFSGDGGLEKNPRGFANKEKFFTTKKWCQNAKHELTVCDFTIIALYLTQNITASVVKIGKHFKIYSCRQIYTRNRRGIFGNPPGIGDGGKIPGDLPTLTWRIAAERNQKKIKAPVPLGVATAMGVFLVQK